jgi:hypothetical protein
LNLLETVEKSDGARVKHTTKLGYFLAGWVCVVMFHVGDLKIVHVRRL